MDRTIRVFELIALDDGVTRSLLEGVEYACRAGGRVSLVEVDVSAHAPRMQRTLLELGFLPAAYVPAMVFTDVEREDVVKMVRLYEEPVFDLAPLSPRAQAVADVVLAPFVTQRVLPEIERAVGDLPLFRGLDADQVRRLASQCRFVRLDTGARVIAQGERDDTLFILLSGRVEIRREGAARPLGSVGPGECLGEMSMLSHQPHSASAIAIGGVEAATLRHRDLEALVRLRPDIGVAIFRSLATGLGEKLGRVSPG